MVTEIDRVSKTYLNGKAMPLEALREVSLKIGPQEFVCLVGPSGCGKSTLLAIVAGLLPPTKGTVLFRNRAGDRRPATGMVFQDLGLFPWRTVFGNVSYGLEELRIPKGERKEIVKRLLQKFGLEGFENRYPHELSGGMKQRLAIARALAPGPSLLLMDEPLSSLDAQMRQKMQMELARIYEGESRSFLYVTHDIAEAVFLGDRVAVMSERPGSIMDVVEVPLGRPRTEQMRKSRLFHSLVATIGDILAWQRGPEGSPMDQRPSRFAHDLEGNLSAEPIGA